MGILLVALIALAWYLLRADGGGSAAPIENERAVVAVSTTSPASAAVDV
jgi:hypothetical protein